MNIFLVLKVELLEPLILTLEEHLMYIDDGTIPTRLREDEIEKIQQLIDALYDIEEELEKPIDNEEAEQLKKMFNEKGDDNEEKE